ncbi:hypothetical protein WG66_005370, partial [Moniliophthora roreri]
MGVGRTRILSRSQYALFYHQSRAANSNPLEPTPSPPVIWKLLPRTLLTTSLCFPFHSRPLPHTCRHLGQISSTNTIRNVLKTSGGTSYQHFFLAFQPKSKLPNDTLAIHAAQSPCSTNLASITKRTKRLQFRVLRESLGWPHMISLSSMY